MEIFKFIITIIVCYLIGSINVAVLISTCILHKDIRDSGSGNAGATNIARVYGLKLGILTLLGDFLKTLFAIWVGRLLMGDVGTVFSAVACLAGHSWPIFFHFKGGKGVAASAMIALILDWRLFAILIGVFAVVYVLTKRVSVGSMACGISFPIVQVILGDTSDLRIYLGIFITLLVLFKHRDNIKRLKSGTEPAFKPKV